MVKGCTTVCGGGGTVVEVAVKLFHHLLGGERHGGLSTSRGVGRQLGGDVMGGHGQVGGAKGVAPLIRGSKFYLHCTVEGDELQLPGCPCLGRSDKAIPGKTVVGEGIGGEESRGGHGCQTIVCDGEGGSSGICFGIVEAVDELQYSRVFCPP